MTQLGAPPRARFSVWANDDGNTTDSLMAAPLLLQSLPLDNATGVSVTANLGLGFDQAVKAGSGFIRIYKADGTLFHTIAITDTSQVTFSTTQPARVVINPNVDLVAGTGYYILVDAGAIENVGGEDYAGISSPTTLNFTTAGTAPGDTVAPLLNSTTPADNATGVAVGSNLVLTFNEAVKAGSGNIEIRKVSDGTIAKTIAITDTTQATFSGSELTINPTTDLAAGTDYYVTFASGVVRDLPNNNFAGISSSTAFNFTTASADSVAPLLVSTTPLDDATGVAVGANITLTFNEAVHAGTGLIVIRNVVGGTIARTISVTDATQVSFSGNQLTINPTTNLAENHAYYVTLTSDAVRDLAGNPFAGISSSTTFNFTTAGTADTTAPILTSTSPLDNAINVAPETDIVLTFNEVLQAGSGYVVIAYSNGGLAQAIPLWDESQITFAGNQVTIDPLYDLHQATSYYISIGSSLFYDLAGNAYAGISSPTTFNFTVGADTTAPLLIHTYPADDASNVDRATDLFLTFDDIVQPGSGDIEIHKASDGSLVASIAITDATKVVIYPYGVSINPANDFDYGETYYVIIGSGVILDDAGRPFAGISSPTTFNFSIPPDIAAPLLVNTSPVDDETGVDIGTNLVLTFDEPVKAGSGNIQIRNASDGSIARTIAITDASQISFSGNDLTINPSTDFADDADYYVTFAAGVVLDLSGNEFAGISSSTALNFSTPPHFVIGTPGVDTLFGDENRDDVLDGRTGLDTLTGDSGDDTYIIRNYEGGQTSILLYTADGEYVYSYLPSKEELALFATDFDGDGAVDLVQVDYDAQTEWTFWFSAALGANLVPGTYANAEPSQYPPTGHPGLAISGGFFGFFYYDTGSFTVDEAVFDYSDPTSPVLVSLSISFERYSYNGGPTLYGRLNYNYAAAGTATTDTIVEAPGGGTDTVIARVSVTLPDNVENLTLLDTGHQNDWDSENLNGTGNGLTNVIVGNTGNNIIDGGGGADTMSGGEGNDSYVVDNAGDSVVENPGEGTDSVQSSVTYTLDPNLENLTLTGNANVNGTGNDSANILIGNAGTNVLTGGDGDDTYTLNSVADSVVEAANKGNDTVFASFTEALDANVENLTLTGTGNINGTGNTLHNILMGSHSLPGGGGQNVLTGGIGDDTLNGRTGVDTLIGGVGDDTYIIENYEGGQTSILIQGQPGEPVSQGRTLSFLGNLAPWQDNLWDQTGDGIVDGIFLRYMDGQHYWTFTFQSTWLGSNLAPGTYVDATAVDGAPGYARIDVSGDSIAGGDFGNFTIHELTIDYSGDTPVLVSLSISFEQIAYPGAPPLYGLINYNYAPAGPAIYDTIVENAGEGNDKIVASVSYTLTANIENLVLASGADNINATGNELNNTITGNDGDNILDGGAGADAMEGKEGDDTYILDNVGDTVFEQYWWGGNDTVVSPFTYTLGGNVENLTLTGAANINGTGNELNNILMGNAGANILTGGLGYDTYYVDPSDTIVEGASSDADTVYAGFTCTLGNNLENLWLTGIGNINATGNAAENLLVGNSGNNILDGGLSNDLLQGNEGNDTYRIQAGAGNDTIYGFTAGAGIGDVVVLDGITFANFNAILSAMTPSYGGHTLLNLGNGQSLLFYGVQQAQFAADDFVFSAPSGPEPFTLPVSGAYTNTISGSWGTDNLTGTNANNRLDGKQGNDTMTGLGGDDTYLVNASGDVVVEGSGQGIDTVISSASSYVLANNVENLTLTGTNTHTATGNGLNNLIIASSRPDIINGGAGNDIIRVGTGAYVLTGGTGNDMFDFDLMGSLKTVTDFQVGQDLVDFRSLLGWYGGSNPVGDGAISVTATAGGVLISVKATAGGSLQSLVKLTGISVGDVDVGGDILWDA